MGKLPRTPACFDEHDAQDSDEVGWAGGYCHHCILISTATSENLPDLTLMLSGKEPSGEEDLSKEKEQADDTKACLYALQYRF